MDTEALWLTLRLAALTTVLLIAIALPLAGWIAFATTRARFLAEAIIALPLVLPPTVLGFYLLVGLGPTTAIGRAVIAMLGHTLAFSFQGLVLGSVLYSLPFAVQPIIAGLRAVDPAYLDAAATLGASPSRRFMRIAMPLAKGSIVTAAVLAFTHTVGEFGVVLMLGGSIPGRTKTLSIALYDLVENGDFNAASRLALLLLGFSTIALILLYMKPFQRRSRVAA
ncbi:molybdate ABC transporter permease subunit [Terriglobus roseus]|uniref:Molybdenum transport system permease n=1 Tax=Terriglobus roseus TaxID=392734 RepID=A0A1H4S8C4_9BACT|nr:molybdate ABC transporter permease subunit [Terriglobus roseus]SEC40329.1 molybdate transport system permease protein [Terriglobus roseus]